MESADPAMNFTFARREKAHAKTRVWLSFPGTKHERFAIQIVPNEVTLILLRLDMLRELGLVINADSAHNCKYEVAVSDSCDSAPIWPLL